MTKLPYREHHLLTLLSGYSDQSLPLDLFISGYFRAHKALGSKDRGYIAETAYSMVRWQGLLDHVGGFPGWDERFAVYQAGNLAEHQKNVDIPLHIRMSFPKNLFDLLVKNYGETRACELCLISNKAAPTTVRANVMKTSREALLELWKDRFPVEPCAHSSVGILFREKTNFFCLPEFQAGLFEVQDEGSQLVSTLVQAEPGQHVLDYCSGSGGKTLAFAPHMQGKGQIYVHDVRKRALQEARIRLRRAGIQNIQIVQAESPQLKTLKKKMDWVLVDAPCTGTGTMRRNPDMKWRFSDEMLQRLVGQQRMIFEKALSFLKPTGTIVFVTCSILKEENEEQVAHFMKTYGLEVMGEPFQSMPSDGGMDGLFGIRLKLGKANGHGQ